MNLLYATCATLLLVLMKSNRVTSQSEDEKKFAQVVVAKYTRVRDDFSSNITEAKIKYKSFPNLGFGNKLSFTFEVFIGATRAGQTAFLLNFNKGDFDLQQYKFKGSDTADTPDKDIKSMDKADAACVKKFKLVGSTYKGTYPACGLPKLPNGKVIELEVTLNCTFYTFAIQGKYAVFSVTRPFELPKNLAPAKALCPK